MRIWIIPSEVKVEEVVFHLHQDGFSMEDENIEWFYFCSYWLEDFLNENAHIPTITIPTLPHQEEYNRYWDVVMSEELLRKLKGKGPYPGVKTFNFPRMKKIFPNLDYPLIYYSTTKRISTHDGKDTGKLFGEEGEEYLDSLKNSFLDFA